MAVTDNRPGVGETLEQRLARVEDRLELSELRARFCQYADERLWAELAGLFAEDAVFDVAGPVQGRAAILEFVSGLPERWERWWHFLSTETIQVDGDTASGLSYFDAPYVADGVSFSAVGRYDDTFVRENGEWRFATRVLSFAWTAPIADGWSAPLPNGLRPAGKLMPGART
jgi:hypothetical protein